MRRRRRNPKRRHRRAAAPKRRRAHHHRRKNPAFGALIGTAIAGAIGGAAGYMLHLQLPMSASPTGGDPIAEASQRGAMFSGAGSTIGSLVAGMLLK